MRTKQNGIRKRTERKEEGRRKEGKGKEKVQEREERRNFKFGAFFLKT